jgi:hypothetical protein
MSLIKRLKRLWQLSALQGDFISRDEADALISHLRELEVEIEDMNHRVSDWIGEIMKSELLRREIEKRDRVIGSDLLRDFTGKPLRAGRANEGSSVDGEGR